MQGLRTIIRANSVFSEASGAILLFGAGALDSTFGVAAWLLAAVGGSLIGYGATLWLLARRVDVRPIAKWATMLDADWVLGAILVLVVFPNAMTTAGRLAMVVVSLIVTGLAVEQLIGLRRTATFRGAGTVGV